ncbi:hypothetical protein [Micromonospora purpureochromogenes]|uniref:Uncharacterized protein n=1 Tax=Micromonospora purpureochromogenes TaxID=47872 RepID=A0ABX2RUP7_9ACTN|nr:hypothetical protein [Micromonospora purpureochromogenes]NYF58989.1 hypothetical protein [Micromonospora purpureochromogenes]
MKRKRALDFSWDKGEESATYVTLSLLIVGQLASLASQPLENFMDKSGTILLLATALLLVFRRINRHLERTSTALSQVGFADAVSSVAATSHRTAELFLFANDGTKYYHFLSEQKFAAARLRVLLCDASHAAKWQRLAERRLVGEVEVRHARLDPILHLFGSQDGGAMMGPFIRRAQAKASPGETFFVSPLSVDGRAVANALSQIFESAWAAAIIVDTTVEHQ